MSDLIARAEAAMEGVTAGPWRTWRDDIDEPLSVVHEEPIGDGSLFSAWPKIAEEFWEDADAEFIAAARTLVPDLVAELKAAQQFRYQVADALGFVETVEGYGRVIVGRDDEIIEHVQHHTDTALKHEADCPVWCDDCEHYEIDRSCKRCGGSGCGPGTASGAFEPCGDCDGGCRDHANAYVYAPDIEAELKAARAQRDEFRAQLDHECAGKSAAQDGDRCATYRSCHRDRAPTRGGAMTDVHARITETLQGHGSDGCDYCSCGLRYSWGEDAPGWDTEWAGHATDVLLTLPGIAVVGLPEADPNGLFWFRENCYVYVDPEDALIMTQRGTTHGTAGEARETAAALLAAADAAEGEAK